MKLSKLLAVIAALLLILTACSTKPDFLQEDPVEILLSDQQIMVAGEAAATDSQSRVYVANDIVYYESGKDFTYGEGTLQDTHSAEEAAAHTVVHIAQPGTYRISGKLSKGQIAVDLGEDAQDDPNAVVTLILDGAEITCQVAPAVIFYRVYECGDTDEATKDVDTSTAGANVIIADGSENTVKGSYVARIYKPDSVELNDAGTEVKDAKKLHKYDGAFYSKMSMNITGEKQNTGVLNIYAENEGLDTELHLTVNGGNINIFSGNDGINTNEDGVSVTTVNGGSLNIRVTGQTGEGDGIDSNGWLVINGGTVVAAACSDSADAGIDSDMGIHINGGTVIASGHMLDRIEDGGQTYAVFNFAQEQDGTAAVSLKKEDGAALFEHCPQNGYSVLVYSSPALKEGNYTLWSGEQQLAGYGGGMLGGMGMPGGMMPPEGMEQGMPPEGMEFPNADAPNGQKPEGMEPPAGEIPNGQMPEGMEPPAGEMPNGQMPEGMEPPQKPGGQNREEGSPGGMPQWNGAAGEQTTAFVIAEGANMFSGISPAQ